ncbi:MAG: mechanosensitive ion channel family protein [Ilyomonas sp.]
MDIKTHKDYSAEEHEVKETVEPAHHKVWISTYIFLALACITAYFLFRLKTFDLLGTYRNILLKVSLAAFFCFIVLIIAKIIEGIVMRKTHAKGIRYNMVRLVRLLTLLVIAFIIISFLNENWYTAAVSLGLISLILGFALQSPIASLIGWFYIVIRAPYKVGDRIQVQSFTGDVVEISYLDTTLWEFAGTYMTNDLPSGRLIRFPNSLVWQYEVYNYSWKKFPYIWNEIPFYVAFQSDLPFIEQTIRSVAKGELGDVMEDRVEEMRKVISQTPVDELEIKDYPFVNFRVNANTWVEVLLIYLVDPKKASSVRTNLIKKVLAALNQASDKVMMPKGDSR